MEKIIGSILQMGGLKESTKVYEVLNFFMYETIKLLFILSIMIFIISYIRSFFPPEKVKEKLNKYSDIRGNIFASLLGVVTPFCSCSSVPIFIGFVESGVSLGATFSFLITSPLINEAAFGILVGAFGIKVAAVYLITGITIGVVGGRLIGMLKKEDYIEEFVFNTKVGSVQIEDMDRSKRLDFAKTETMKILKNVYKFIILGILVGSFIHGYAPADVVMEVAGKGNLLAVPTVVILGVPMYAGAIGTIPIAKSLILKGAGLGTALAFMMAVTALSLPEMIMLKKVMKAKLLGIFVLITSISIIFVGYMFNIIF